ncbi:DUF262 domain-containing protein (plasmid) [Stutzerimonas frequens]|uniref:DUF262 domain-containing protein n=1 Tax=Stutzerimonas frequens TaxID=2968969 RepID=UPI002DBD4DE8|nr:DUF262 domain-containing protein [Stutzerimonas frequens]WRW29344.1 DUF262 domain-containing protein [Stutzerimonas frequens]
MAREHNDYEQQLCDLIKPLRAARWTTDIQWADLERRLEKLGQDYGALELNPDFQRGHVWTQRQQVHYIENCLRGVVPASSLLIQFNCPEFSDDGSDSDLPDGLQCVDGLQRYTAVTEFVQGRIKPFGLTVQEYVGTQFSAKRMFIKVAIHGYTRRTDLLEHYLSLNAGGTPHSDSEIERVRELLAEARMQRGLAGTVATS